MESESELGAVAGGSVASTPGTAWASTRGMASQEAVATAVRAVRTVKGWEAMSGKGAAQCKGTVHPTPKQRCSTRSRWPWTNRRPPSVARPAGRQS